MHSKRTICLVILVGLTFHMPFVPISAATSEPSWTKLMLSAYDTNDPRYYLAAVLLAEKYGENDPRLHIALFNAAVKYRWSNPKLAESLLKRDIADLVKLDPDFPDLVYQYFELARVYEWEARYDEAEPPLLRALAIREKWQDVSSDDPSTAEILACLYFVYQQKRETAKAAATEARMLNSLQSIRNELTRAYILGSVEFLFSSQGHSGKNLDAEQRRELIGKARDLSDRAVFYFRKHKVVYNLAGQLSTSAGFALECDDLKTAESYARESLRLSFANFEQMADVPWSGTHVLCSIVCKKGHYNEAEQLQEGYLSALARTSGSRSPKYARVLTEIAYFWEVEKQPKLAAKWKERAKLANDWLKKNPIEEHPRQNVN